MKKRALLVVDMQKKFARGFGRTAMDRAAETMLPVIEAFRTRGDLVVWIQHESRLLGLVQGTPAFSIIDRLVPQAGDGAFVKRKGNAFLGTELDQFLRERNVEGVYVCGYAAEGCVRATYSGGRRLGYSTFKLKDGTASGSRLLLRLFRRMGESVDRRELVP